ncbi:UNVERIFIED_CONTAM: hypothetical protein BEN50_03350 [Euhalothece sp. KZN 001]
MRYSFLALLTAAIPLVSSPATAQIIPDNSLGNESSTVRQDTINNLESDVIEGGALRENNLFHSFQEFQINAGRGAYFANPDAVTNILTRVTGTNISQILGTLGVLGDANLFLINPNGITFGNDASLDLNGSFFASTADSLIFENGFEFSASNPEAPPLLTVNIPVGLRFRDNAGDIVMETASPPQVANETEDAGQLLETSQTVNDRNTSVPDQITGELTGFSDADLYEIFLPEGTEFSATTVGQTEVDTSLYLFDQSGFGIIANDNAETSEFTLQSTLPTQTINAEGIFYLGISSFANDPLSEEGAIFDFFGEPNGVGANSPLTAWSDSGFDSGNYTIQLSTGNQTTNGGNFQVNAGETLALIGGDVVINGKEIVSPGSNVEIGGLNASGVVAINPDLSLSYPPDVTAAEISLINQAGVNVRGNNGGRIAIYGRNLNFDRVGLRVGIDQGLGFPDARAGSIKLTATDSASITNESVISNAIASEGKGNIGNVEITSPLMMISGASSVNTINLFGEGTIGNVELNGETIFIREGSSISSQTAGVGGAGNVNIVGASSVAITDAASINTSSFSVSDAGNVEIETEKLNLNNIIMAASLEGENVGQEEALNAGNINIKVSELIATDTQLINDSVAKGNAGNVTIQAELLNFDNAQIFSGILENGTGNGGIITLNVNETITLNNNSSLNANNEQNTLGNSGQVEIKTEDLTFDNNSRISVEADGTGNGGEISIEADTIQFKNDSSISTRLSNQGDGNSGNIEINAKTVALTQGSNFSTSATQGKAGNINITASDQLLLEGNGQRGGINANLINPIAETVGKAGNITLATASLEITNGADVSASSDERGDGGNIQVMATDEVILQGGNLGATPVIRTNIDNDGRGNAGNINIETAKLDVSNDAFISAETSGIGNAGDITIIASETVRFDGLVSAISSSVIPNVGEAIGDGGEINITTGSIEFLNGAKIESVTLGQGNGGNITIEATETVTFDGSSTGLFTDASAQATGTAGNLTITANVLELLKGATLQASTRGEGDAGHIEVTTQDLLIGVNSLVNVETSDAGKAGNITISTDQLTLSENASLSATATPSAINPEGGGNITINSPNLTIAGELGIFAETEGETPAGTLTLQPNTNHRNLNVQFTDQGLISASTSGRGAGGNINLNAPSEINLSGTGRVAVETSDLGDAGDINITSQNLILSDGVEITASTTSVGAAGEIVLNLTDNLSLTDSQITASTSPDSVGRGGNIDIDPDLVTLDNSSILVNSEGAGDAGNIFLVAGDLFLDHQSTISAETASGEGGNINLSVADLLRLDNNSPINTTAGGTGNGGDLTINSQLIVANDNSDIRANAFEGTGGNINLTAQGLFFSPDSEIDASSDLGIDGVVETNTPDVDPAEGLIELESDVVDAAELIAQNVCEQTEDSEFVITGKGGLPPNPDDFQVPENTEVDLILPSDSSTNSTQSDVSTVDSLLVEKIVPARGLIVDENGQATLVGYNVNQELSQRQKKTFNSCLPN